MLDYGFNLTVFAILIIFLIYYLIHQRLPIRMNKTYLELLIIETVFVPFEMLVRYLNSNYENVSGFLLYLLNTVLLLAYMIRILWFFRFTLNFLKIRPEDSWANSVMAMVVSFISSLMILTNAFTKGVFYFNEEGYKPGPLYGIMVHFCFFFYVIISIVLLHVNSKKVSRRSLLGAMAYNIALLIGNIVAIFAPTQRTMNIFCLIALILMYLSFQNPDFYNSDRGPAFNLRAFRAMLDEMVRRRSYHIMGVVLQNYNDERGIYGGERMDEALSEISRYLAKTFSSHMVFHLRNGSFAILDASELQFDRIRDRIVERFDQPWLAGSSDMFLNVSFVEMDPELNLTKTEEIVDHLMIAFENAASKVEPCGVIVLNSENVRKLDHNIEIKHMLDEAIDHNSVEVYFQPIFNAKTRELVGAEALARLHDYRGRIVSPCEFIPLAEKNGQINKLGEQVFEKVCASSEKLYSTGGGLSWINVNLSPVQCMKRDLCDRFVSIVKKYDVPIDKIHLEVTEESMGDISVMTRQIDYLRSNGFMIVLDDYGTGYSNLARVKRYPFINIKIDMEVIWSYFKQKDDLLPTIIQAFKNMNYTVTAEGVGSAEMADALTGMGCDFLQGFYFSQPLTFEEFVEKYKSVQ